jgi:hypothetical protein
LKYITSNDAKDRKYHLELAWFEFTMGIKNGNEGQEGLAKECLQKITAELDGI